MKKFGVLILKMIKTFFKGLFKVVLSMGLLLVLFLSTFIATLIFYPQLILNTKVVTALTRHFLPNSMVLGWQEFSFKTSSLSLTKKSFDIQFRNLCFLDLNSKMDLCLKEGRMSFDVNFGLGEKWGLEKVYIHPSYVIGERISIVLGEGEEGTAKEEKPAEATGQDFWENWPPPILTEIFSQLSKIEFTHLNVIVPKVLVNKGLQTWKGGIELHLAQEKSVLNGQLLINEITGPMLEGKNNKGQFGLTLARNQANLWVPMFVEGQMQVRLKNDKNMELKIASESLQKGPFPVSIDLKSDLKLEQRRLLSEINLVLRKSNLGGKITVRLKKGRGQANLVRTQDCTINSDFAKFNDLWEGVAVHRLTCSLLFPLPEKMAPIVKRGIVPANLITHIRSEARTEKAALRRGGIEINFPRYSNQWISGHINVQAHVDADGGELDFARDFYGQMEGSILVKKAKILQEILADYGPVVPAPLHALDGRIRLDISGDLPRNFQELTMPFSLQTQLSSTNQAFNTHLKAKLILPIKAEEMIPRMEGNFLISDLQVVLPDIDLMAARGLSLPFPDKRIVRQEEEKDKAGKAEKADGKKAGFLLDLKVNTTDLHSIRIANNITSKPIAMGLELRIDQSNFEGGLLKIAPFEMEVLRKKTSINFFNLQLHPELGESEILGELQVDYADYTVYVKLDGTVGRPVVLLESRPPLSENDVIAVLLFGQPMNELNTTQGDSVASTQTAMADGAMTLASLYFLSSTPIESIAYNPQTKNFSAKVKLDGKTSMTVGTDMEEMRKIALRRNLGRNFILEAELVQDLEKETSSIWTFLEWYKRY